MTPSHNHLDQLTREILHYEDQAISHAGNAIRFKIEIGKRLNSAKEILPHGEFLSWAEKHFKWSPRHVQKHMKLARNAPAVSHLPPDCSLRMALQAIAPPKDASTPAAAPKERFVIPVRGGEVVLELKAGDPDELADLFARYDVDFERRSKAA